MSKVSGRDRYVSVGSHVTVRPGAERQKEETRDRVRGILPTIEGQEERRMGGRFVWRKRIKPRTRLAMLSLCLTTSSDPDGWKNGWMDEPMTVKERRHEVGLSLAYNWPPEGTRGWAARRDVSNENDSRPYTE